MPTDLVGGIRRYLEQSHISPSSSSSSNARELYKQRSISAESVLHYDSNSESDEAESAYVELEYQSPLSSGSYDASIFCDTIDQHLSEGELLAERGVSELHSQLGLSREHSEVVGERSMQNFSDDNKVTLHSEPSSRVEAAGFGLVDDDVALEYVSSNLDNMLEVEDGVHEKIAQTANGVNVERKRGLSNPSDEISTAANYIKLQAGNFDPSLQGTNDDSDTKMLAEDSNPSAGAKDLEDKYIQNLNNITDANEAEIPEVYSITSSVSWEDKYPSAEYPDNTFSFPKVNNLQEVDLIDSSVETSATDLVSSCTQLINRPLSGKDKELKVGPYHMREDPLLEVKESYAESSGTKDTSHIDNLSTSEVAPLSTKGGEAWEWIPPPSRVGDYELETEQVNFPAEPLDMQSVGLETKIMEGTAEANITCATSNDCMATRMSNAHTKENTQSHGILTRPALACAVERISVSAEESRDLTDQGDAAITHIVSSIKGTADGNRTEKEPKKCNKESVPELDSIEEVKTRAKRKRVLKSVAGAMTLLGALFFVHHVRRRREKERNTEAIAPQSNYEISQKRPVQKKADVVIKPGAVYPGDRLRL